MDAVRVTLWLWYSTKPKLKNIKFKREIIKI